MDSATLALILEWAVAPLYLWAVWLTLRIFSMDKRITFLEADQKRRDEHRQAMLARLAEHNEALHNHNDAVTARLQSIEEFLRNGHKSG